MPLVRSLHHINFVVRDINAAKMRFAAQLGLEFGASEELPARGVVTVRARLAETWIVLVQPVTSAGVVAGRLAAHGEGVFLLSFAVPDLEQARTLFPQLGHTRTGLDGWQVADLPHAVANRAEPVVLQLCESA